jgi:putative ABC transport system permease protein
MFINEILRFFKRNLTTGILSILGFSIGLAVAIIIGVWSLHEFSFDQFHRDHERIYRIIRKGTINNEQVVAGSDFSAMGPAVKEKFPEVEDFTRVSPFTRTDIQIDENINYETGITVVDKNFFSFFSFPLVSGNPATCLSSPDNIVIDQEWANKYFPGKNAVGQQIKIFGKTWQVSAVCANFPSNSHLSYHALLPIDGLEWINRNDWQQNDSFLTYVRLHPDSNIPVIEKNILKLSSEKISFYKQFISAQILQQLDDIHLNSNFRFDRDIKVNNKRTIFIFITVAILILLIACFNFINLFISTSFLRAKSLGIRKINGSTPFNLLCHSIAETLLYVMVSSVIALIMVRMAIPYFNQWFGAEISLQWSNTSFFLLLTGILLLTVLISGLVPVFYMLRFNPVDIVHHRFNAGGVTLLQKVLIIGQFTASIALVTSSAFIKKQMNYIQNKDLGFDKSQIIYINPSGSIAQNYDNIREELLKCPAITDVTAKSCLPSDWNNGNPIALAEDPDNSKLMEVNQIKLNYPEMMNMSLLEGRLPITNADGNSSEALINQQGAAQLGLKQPIGRQITRTNNEKFTIVGILKDANTKSLHDPIDPQIYLSLNKVEGWHVILIKVQQNTPQAIEAISKIWRENTNTPFEYHFLDEAYDKMYKNDQVAGKIINVSMAIAILLAAMGLFAIAGFTTSQRVKEIGIRKVNGATVFEVVSLLNRNFLKWVLIAYALAIPIAWYAMHHWLDNFAYKTPLSWWVFIISGVIAILVALLTVSGVSWKAATGNPVKALRNE